MIQIPSFIQNLEPYKPGMHIEALKREKKVERVVKLASNENPLGPSPKAMSAIKETTPHLHRYPDTQSFALLNALSQKVKKKPCEIVCGHGTDALLAYIINAFTAEDDEVLTSEGTFIGIYVNVNKLGRKLVKVPLKNYAYDLEAIEKRISKTTKIIYLANPNNPTGTLFSKKEFEGFISSVSKNILVILDEAYVHYAATYKEYPNGLDYDFPNLIVTRTFSKAYGLGGLRLGFAIANSPLIEQIYKVKLPFEPHFLAQVGGSASLSDEEFLKKTMRVNLLSLEMMEKKFEELGISYIKSYANFMLLLFKNEKEASLFHATCLNKGLILRHTKSFGIPNAVRISSGTIEETIFALNTIETVWAHL